VLRTESRAAHIEQPSALERLRIALEHRDHIRLDSRGSGASPADPAVALLLRVVERGIGDREQLLPGDLIGRFADEGEAREANGATGPHVRAIRGLKHPLGYEEADALGKL